jgi:hypothetical protein
LLIKTALYLGIVGTKSELLRLRQIASLGKLSEASLNKEEDLPQPFIGDDLSAHCGPTCWGKEKFLTG